MEGGESCHVTTRLPTWQVTGLLPQLQLRWQVVGPTVLQLDLPPQLASTQGVIVGPLAHIFASLPHGCALTCATVSLNHSVELPPLRVFSLA